MGVNKVVLVVCCLIILSMLNGTFAYKVYIDRNFGEKKNCIAGYESIISTSMQTSSGISSFCQSQCFGDSFTKSQKLSALLIINGIGVQIQTNVGSDSDYYSYVTFEFSYFGLEDITVNLMYPTTGVSVIPYDQPTQLALLSYSSYTFPVADNPSSYDGADYFSVLCGSSTKQIRIGQIKFLKSALLHPTSALVFSASTATTLSYIRSIRISKNCVQNCLVCGSDTSCSTCQTGFTSYMFSSGVNACEEVGSVCSSLSNCHSCALSGSDSVCLSCIAGFTLSSGSCTANTPSPASPCTATQYNQNGVCTQYSSLGYYEDRYDSSFVPITLYTSTQIQTIYKCPAGKLAIVYKENNYQNFQCKCFFDQCISCSTPSSCDVCESGYVFDLYSKLCKESTITNNQIELIQNVTSTGYIFEIVLSKGLQYTGITVSDIAVLISDFSDYTYNLIGFTGGNTISIGVACQKLVKNKKITITFTNIIFVSANAMTQSSLTTDLEAYLNLSQNEYDRANNAKTIAKIVATIIVWFLIPIAICGYFSTIMQTVDVVAFLYYILYVSVRFPINVTSFAQAFKILQLSVVLNFFGTLVNDNTFLDSAVKWMKQTTDCYFLASTGQSVSVFFVVIGLYLFTKMMAKMEFAYISDYFQKAVIRTWEFGGILDGVWLVYVYVLVGVFLQFQNTGCNESSCSLNYTLFAFSGILVGLIPLLILILVRYANNVQYEDYLVMKLGSLFTGVRLFTSKDLLVPKEELTFHNFDEPVKQPLKKDTPPQSQINFSSSAQLANMTKRQKLMFTWTKYVIPILYARRILFALIISFIYHYPYVQIIAISAMNFAILSYFLIIQPFTSKYQNLKSAISELFLIVFQALTVLLISDKEDQNENTRILIGWGLITVSSILIIWHAISIIVQFYKVVRASYLQWKSGRSRAKVSSFNPTHSNDLEDSPEMKKSRPILQFGNNRNSVDKLNIQTPLEKKSSEENVGSLIRHESAAYTSGNSPLISTKRLRKSQLPQTPIESQQDLQSANLMKDSEKQLSNMQRIMKQK